MTKRTTVVCLLAMAVGWPLGAARAVEYDKAVLPLLTRPFFHGRDYFVLNSGRTKMIVQADKADLAPAFLYLLFDGDDYRQSKDKDRALNFAGGQGMVNSALEVVLGGHPFTAIGHQTETRWPKDDSGIPAVEAVWWAGGLRVTEWIGGVDHEDAFGLVIRLESVNLAGPEKVTLRLSLPPGDCTAKDGMLLWQSKRLSMALGVLEQHSKKPPSRVIAEKGVLEIGPLVIAPGKSTGAVALLSAQVAPAEKTRSTLLALDSEPRVLDACRRTESRWAAASTLKTDDAVVQDLFKSVRCGLPGMISENGIADYGMLEYGSQVVRDASNTMLGLLHLGQFELAKAGFEHILKDMVRDQGAAMIDNKFDEPDREELDQMGELMHALKAYRDWTGDDSLIRKYRTKLVALVERPLGRAFRDKTGMVHNRREYWERTLDDGYETAYQTYVILGLRDAAELAEPLGVHDRAERWRAEADRVLQAMLKHPKCALVEKGRLIKRRGVDGKWIKTIPARGIGPDVPGRTESVHLAEPDATLALPIAYGIIDPHSELARKTLDHLEGLWSARWPGGGYGRYNPTCEWDQPGPWPFATCFLMRAQHEAGRFERSRRALEWLRSIPGGRTGAWPEEIPVIHATTPGILPWNAAEVALFIVRHWLGVRFEGNRLVLKPALYAHTGPVSAVLRFRKRWLHLAITGPGPIEFAEVDGRRIEPDRDGAIRLPADFTGGERVLSQVAGGEVVLHAKGEKKK